MGGTGKEQKTRDLGQWCHQFKIATAGLLSSLSVAQGERVQVYLSPMSLLRPVRPTASP